MSSGDELDNFANHDLSKGVQPHTQLLGKQTPEEDIEWRSATGMAITARIFNPDHAWTRTVGPVLALLIQVGLIVFLVVIAIKPIAILATGAMSANATAGYTLGTTVLASLIAVFTHSQIRMLWLEDIVTTAYLKRNKNGSASQRRQSIDKARLLLGIGSMQSWLRFPQLTVTFVVMAVMAGTLVASVSPSPLERASSTFGDMDNGEYPSASSCWMYTDSPQPHSFAAPTLNGSFLVPTVRRDGAGQTLCVADQVMDALRGTQTMPTNYQYQLGNALVNSSALGTPIRYIYVAQAISSEDHLLRYPSAPPFEDVLSWSNCAPNVLTNPVQCSVAPAGTISQLSNGSTIISANGCNYTDNILFTNGLDTQGRTVSQVCPVGPGQATILLGAIGQEAGALAQMMGSSAVSNFTFAINCTVDVWPTIGARMIEWSKLNDPSVAFYTQYTVGAPSNSTAGTACDPQWYWNNNGEPQTLPTTNPTLENLRTDGTLTAPLVALQAVLNENQASDGWPQTLSSMAGVTDGTIINEGTASPSYAFNTSRNSIEDAMGVVVAAALSLEWGVPDLSQNQTLNAQQKWFSFLGTWTIQGQRIGPGQWWAIAFVVPEVFAVIVILGFLVRRLWHESQSDQLEKAWNPFQKLVDRFGFWIFWLQ